MVECNEYYRVKIIEIKNYRLEIIKSFRIKIIEFFVS